MFVTGQRKMPADSFRGDKLLKQRSWKLDGLSRGATSYDVACRPAIIVEILIRRDAEVEFISVHGIRVLAVKAKRRGKASRSGREPAAPGSKCGR